MAETSLDSSGRPVPGNRRAGALVGHGLLVALGLAALVLHGVLLASVNGSRDHPDEGWLRLGAAIAAIPSVPLAAVLLLAGLRTGAGAVRLRWTESVLGALLLGIPGIELAVAFLGV